MNKARSQQQPGATIMPQTVREPGALPVTHLHYRLHVPYPVDVAFKWLTDYDDGDASRAQHVLVHERRVVARNGNVIRLEGRVGIGKGSRGSAEVRLFPPDHYVATLSDPMGRPRGTYDYRLTPADAGRASLLTIDYAFVTPRLKHRLLVTWGAPLIRLKLRRMWGNFIAEMKKDLGPPR